MSAPPSSSHLSVYTGGEPQLGLQRNAGNGGKRPEAEHPCSVQGDFKWQCVMYRPSTMTRYNNVIETGNQVVLSISECINISRREKRQGERTPLVLQFWGRHYSVFVHQQAIYSPVLAGVVASKGEQQLPEQGDEPAEDSVGVDIKMEDIDSCRGFPKLQKCLQGLKKEIQMILRTVSDLSVPEQRRLLRIDPTEADAEETPKERMQPLQMRGSKKAASNGISIPQRFQREARSNMSLR
ncbi:hypothetical protein PC114_g25904 [Phytophthora cactorum]|nr:hypothetical protein PC112_g21852 [Phytophthora cactorum]KAG2873356.1 hypothetical protein PC114_g25904 [Phytophthora cactorum]KAG3127951.1 hypothetical protein C6341_g24772 [Phytophthora cactorum]